MRGKGENDFNKEKSYVKGGEVKKKEKKKKGE